MNIFMLDIQTQSLRDSLIFSGILEHPSDSPKTLIKDFIKIPTQTPTGPCEPDHFLTLFTVLDHVLTNHPDP